MEGLKKGMHHEEKPSHLDDELMLLFIKLRRGLVEVLIEKVEK